jgi:hypothetical protein
VDDEDGYFGERSAASYDETADVYGPGEVAATVGVLARLAGSGRALELGIGTGRIALPWHISPERSVFYSYDLATQAMQGHYIEFTDGRGEYSSIPFRYVWPSELDLMAELAGLVLRDRWAGWDGEPFTGDSTKHISVWQRPVG